MFNVYAVNLENTADFSEKFIEKRHAWDTFIDVCSAADCGFAIITDGLTGELLVEFKECCLTIYDKDGNWEDFLFE